MFAIKQNKSKKHDRNRAKREKEHVKETSMAIWGIMQMIWSPFVKQIHNSHILSLTHTTTMRDRDKFNVGI